MRNAKHLLALTSLIFILVACTSGGTTQKRSAASSPTATPTPVLPAGTLLFQSDWSQGLNTWGHPAGWTAVQGAVQSDSRENNVLTVPFSPPTPNYALEVRFQVVSVPANGGEFTIQALAARGKDGYVASILNLLSPAPHSEFSHPQLQIYTTSIANGNGTFHPGVYLPGTAIHTFRLAVQGPEVDLFADGISKGSALSPDTPRLSSGPLQVVSSGVVMRILSVRITAL